MDVNLTNDGVHRYQYDQENRIVSVDSGRAAYTYDGDGQRVVKSLWGGGGTLYWYGPDGQILAESDLGGYLKSEYVYFNGKRLARTDNPTDPATAQLRYYFSDHLGSTSMVMDETFTTIEEDTDYYPYGGVANEAGLGDSNHFKFTGKERDSETGNDYFGARYYTSNMGRFMTPDWSAKPVTVPYAHFGNPQSLNLYTYVQNNPTTLGDPDGHGDAMTFCNSACQNRPISKAELQLEAATLAASGVAIGAPEILAAGAAAETVSQGLGVGLAALGAAGAGVNATVNVIGAVTNTDVKSGTDMVTNVTNPVAGATALATHSSANGPVAADAVTVGRTAYNLASGNGMRNPAESASAMAGVAGAVKNVASSALSALRGLFSSSPSSPPSPSLPGAPSTPSGNSGTPKSNSGSSNSNPGNSNSGFPLNATSNSSLNVPSPSNPGGHNDMLVGGLSPYH